MSKEPTDQKPVDERNIVRPEETDMSMLEPEERLAEFWRRYGNAILTTLFVFAVVLLANQFWKTREASKEAEIQAAFPGLAAEQLQQGNFDAASVDEAALLAFVDAYPEHPLSGLAHVLIGHSRFAAEDYTEAANSYSAALPLLTDTMLIERATLGEAVARVLVSGDASGLTALTADAGVFTDATKAEAAYHLAVLAWENNDLEDMQAQIDYITALPSVESWLEQPINWADQATALMDLAVSKPLPDEEPLFPPPPAPATEGTAADLNAMEPMGPLAFFPETTVTVNEEAAEADIEAIIAEAEATVEEIVEDAEDAEDAIDGTVETEPEATPEP